MPHDSPSNRLQSAYDRIDTDDVHDTDKGEIRTCIERLDRADTTRAGYCRRLVFLSEHADSPLTDMDTEEMNDTAWSLGEAREWAGSTLAQAQSALQRFAEYRGLDPEEIDVTSERSDSSIDPRTVLTPTEFHDMRANASNMRDKALIDLLGYTGQRLRVIQTLRIRDVDPEEGVWHMPDSDGLKGADKTGSKRPLLGARKAVSEWIDMHPTQDPDDHLITTREGYGTSRGDVGGEISQQSIRYALKQAAERAGINKPVNPHAFRHFFVTTCKTQYDMDDGTVKHLIGHTEGSNVMETTYRHLSDDDHIEAAEEAFGIGTDDEESLTPPVCPTCNAPLAPSMASCPSAGCREVFDPSKAGEDAEKVLKDIEQMDGEERNRLADLLGN